MNSAEKEAVLHCLKAMINEEVCEECPLYGTTGTDHCEKDCVRLAINALEQEPCDDAISRQAVLDLPRIKTHNQWGNVIKESVDVEDIRQLSSVNLQEPKTGHWIVHPKGIYAHLVCDKCLSSAPYDCKTNYCPMCGAKMKEGD